jgi:hypothetical protein
MESKYCSACAQKRVLSCFLKNPSANPGTKIFSTCIPCREKSKKRRVLQPLDTNRPSKRPVISRPLFETPTKPSILPIQRLIQPQPRAPQPIPPVQHHAQPQEPIPLVQPRVRPQQPLQPLQPHASQLMQPVQRQVPQSIPSAQPRPIQSVQRLVQPQPILPAQPQAAGFFPPEQWEYIQSFHATMNQVEMETCSRCKERWFAMDPAGVE